MSKNKLKKNESDKIVVSSREKILKLQQYLVDKADGENIVTTQDSHLFPLKHTFADGYYLREINTPAGQILITKIHKEEHPFFLMKGECSVFTEHGTKRIKAPYYDITKPGTKRVIYIHKDVTWVTVHATDLKDLGKIEEKIIAKDFSDPQISIDNLKEIKKKFNIK